MLVPGHYLVMSYYHSNLTLAPGDLQALRNAHSQLCSIVGDVSRLQVGVLSLQNKTSWQSPSAVAFANKVEDLNRKLRELYATAKAERDLTATNLVLAGG